jgi:hypothetical protein
MTAKTTKGQRGRPSDYTPELALSICEKLASGLSLRVICSPDDMPAESTVRLWVIEDREGFSAQYTRSRDIGLDCRADRIEEKIESEGDTQRARLLFDHERWYLSKMAPKRYGDRITQEHTGKDGKDLPAQQPAQVTIFALPDNGR